MAAVKLGDRKSDPYGPPNKRGGGGGNIVIKILCCPCRCCANMGPWDIFIAVVCLFLIIINIPHVVLKDKSYRGTKGLGKMHGKLKETWEQVNISKSWGELELPSMPSIPSLPVIGGGGGGNSTLAGGLGGMFGGLRGTDADVVEDDEGSEVAKEEEKKEEGATSVPTVSPTLAPTKTPPEDPVKVAEEISKQDLHVSLAGEWDVKKFDRPEECSADVIAKVKKSGMDGSNCKGQAYLQDCCFSVLTKNKVPTWLDGYLEEIRDLRTGKVGEEATFVGAVLGSSFNEKCDALEKELRLSDQKSDAAKGALEHILTRPKLFCSHPVSNDFTKKWGMQEGEADLSNLDQHLQDAGVHQHIKDTVLVLSSGASTRAIASGMLTLARTRYVEFDYDWKGEWASTSLKSIVEGLDKIGHTCYWAGKDKLWRITGCWQDFYGYRSWSHLACSNRNLAPKLAERMEKMFKKTIGMK